jgi:hypothetical protein
LQQFIALTRDAEARTEHHGLGVTERCSLDKLLKVDLVGLTFVGHHDLLTDHVADWKPRGNRYSTRDPLHWSKAHSYPLTITAGERVEIDADFEVTGDAPADTATIAVRSRDPFAVMDALIGLFQTYVLTPDRSVPGKFDHPKYKNSVEGGAWPLDDYVAKSAECQAIVRYCRGIVEILGYPGTYENTFVSALPDAPDTAVDPTNERETLSNSRYDDVALIDCIGCRVRDLRPGMHVALNYPFACAALENREITIKVNSYEACLRLTHGGRTRWYGGGAGAFNSARDVLFGFGGMIRYRSLDEGGPFEIVEIIYDYEAHGGH